MKQAIRRQPLEITTQPTKKANKIICNILFGGVVAIALLMIISLLTYHPEDSAWSKTIATTQVYNWLGVRGAYFSDILFTTIGGAAWLIPALLIAYAYRLICQSGYKHLDIETIIIRIVGVALVLLSVASLLNVYNPNDDLMSHGGAVGQLTGMLLNHSIGWVQNLFPESSIAVILSKIILFFLLFITSIMATGCGPLIWVETIGAIMINCFQLIIGLFKSSDQASDNSDLANIEHLMTKDSTSAVEKETPSDEISKEPKGHFFSKFRKAKEATHNKENILEDEQSELQLKTPKMEPSFSFDTTSSDKIEPDFTHSTHLSAHNDKKNIDSTITPKFEPQIDENGQPKLPSIFKRPTIKTAAHTQENDGETVRIKNLSDWANDEQSTVEMPASMFSTQGEPAITNMPDSNHAEFAVANPTTNQSIFAQSDNFTKNKVSAPTSSVITPHEDDQDFNAFLEELEKYHTPELSEEPSLPAAAETTEDFPTVNIIAEPIEIAFELPEVTEIIETFEPQKPEPNFEYLAEPTEPSKIEIVVMPTWEPFEFETNSEPEIATEQVSPTFNLLEEDSAAILPTPEQD
ncbi:DNA translocase FtsK, partial [Wohlfahrtiimonas larvae]